MTTLRPRRLHSKQFRDGQSVWRRVREHPDVVVVGGSSQASEVRAALGPLVTGRLGYALSAVNPTESLLYSGMVERPEVIGQRSVELVASMVQRGEKGIPSVPTVTMIEGYWRQGKSTPRKLQMKPLAKRL